MLFKQKKSLKKHFLILITIVLILSLSACSLAGGPTKIETTDFNDVQALLIEQYELCLPDSAVFVDGYFDNAFRDPGIVIAFTIKKSELEKMLSENWVEVGYIDEPNSFLADSPSTTSPFPITGILTASFTFFIILKISIYVICII